jgi:hypothetical protein
VFAGESGSSCKCLANLLKPVAVAAGWREVVVFTGESMSFGDRCIVLFRVRLEVGVRNVMVGVVMSCGMSPETPISRTD